MGKNSPQTKFRFVTILALILILAGATGTIVCKKDAPPPASPSGTAASPVDIVADGTLDKASLFGMSRFQESLDKNGVAYNRLSSLDKASSARVVLIGTLAGSPEIKKLREEGTLKLADKKEALAVKRLKRGDQNILVLAGADDRGLMYALLDIARRMESLEKGKDGLAAVPEISERPAAPVRGMVVFLHNEDLERDWYYSRKYWEDYLGMLAADRWNTFDLVFSHQTPYLSPMYAFHVNVDQYPEVRAKGLTEEQRKKNLDTLRMISSMAKERGLDFTLSIWQQIAWEGKNQGSKQESMVTGLTRKNMYGYTYQALLKLLKECPDISTIQLRINHESGIDYVEQTAFYKDSVFKAIRDCGHPVLLEVRDVGLLRETVEASLAMGVPVRMNHKYWGEQMVFPYPPTRIMGTYSYGDWLKYPQTYSNIFQVWTLGSHRLLLWGDPDYVRRFTPTTLLEDSVGFEICAPLSQKGFGNAPGDWRIFRDKEREYYQWEFERYWSFYQLFGRLTYNPAASDELWLQELGRRFGNAAAPDVAAAYRSASQVVSLIEAVATGDYNMYIWPEKDMGGLINFYLHLQPYDICRISGFLDHIQDTLAGRLSAKLAPDDVADRLEKIADDAERAIAKAEAAVSAGNKEFWATKMDVLILSSLARYHSQKIRAASRLGFYYALGDLSLLQEARDYAIQGLATWKKLSALGEEIYYDKLVFGPGSFGHWKDNIFFVEKDLEALRYQEDLFKTAPNFDFGYDFGPKPLTDVNELYSPIYTNFFSIEPRFQGVFPNSLYNSQVGFGWQDGGDLKADPPARIARATWRASNLNDLKLPQDALLGDFVQGTKPAVFRIDLPEGNYQAAILMTDRRPKGTDHGPLSVSVVERFGERPIIVDKVVPKGELVIAKFNFNMVGARFSTFRLKLSAAAGADFILNAFTITRFEPHVAHLPVGRALPGKDLTLKATVTLPQKIEEGPKDSLSIARGTTSTIVPPERIERVTLFYSTDGGRNYGKLDMSAKDGVVYAATIPAADVRKGELRYYLESEDSIGQIVRLPKTSGPDSYFRTRVSLDRTPPVVTHIRPISAQPGQPLEIKAKVADQSSIAAVRLYYRPTRQNMEYTVLSMTPQGGEYSAKIPGNAITKEFDIMYYLEAIDEHGNGVFFPNPDIEQPYVVVKVLR